MAAREKDKKGAQEGQEVGIDKTAVSAAKEAKLTTGGDGSPYQSAGGQRGSRLALASLLPHAWVPLDLRTRRMLDRHDFDLHIDLSALDRWERPGGGGWEAAFLHRKQQQEATIGAPVGVLRSSIPKNHKVISLEEYKRRRGLL